MDMKIVEGPGKGVLMGAFADRVEIVFILENGKKTEKMIINSIEHEDGSGNSFILVAMNKFRMYYNTSTKTGRIRD